MKESLSSFLDIWVLPNEICPSIAFELPNSTEYSISLHSNNISESICIFLPKHQENLNQTVYYGVDSNAYDKLILYSNQKGFFLNPLKVCQNILCSTTTSFSSFFQLEHLSLNSTSIHFSLFGLQKTQLPSIIIPIPLYNFSGRYEFGDKFDIASIHELSHPLKKKRLTLLIALILESILMIFAILLKIIIKYMIYKLNKKANKNQDKRERPLTVVLNQYCPNTSALLVSV